MCRHDVGILPLTSAICALWELLAERNFVELLRLGSGTIRVLPPAVDDMM